MVKTLKVFFCEARIRVFVLNGESFGGHGHVSLRRKVLEKNCADEVVLCTYANAVDEGL
jgi:hypothetical protein